MFYLLKYKPCTQRSYFIFHGLSPASLVVNGLQVDAPSNRASTWSPLTTNAADRNVIHLLWHFKLPSCSICRLDVTSGELLIKPGDSWVILASLLKIWIIEKFFSVRRPTVCIWSSCFSSLTRGRQKSSRPVNIWQPRSDCRVLQTDCCAFSSVLFWCAYGPTYQHH